MPIADKMLEVFKETGEFPTAKELGVSPNACTNARKIVFERIREMLINGNASVNGIELNGNTLTDETLTNVFTSQLSVINRNHISELMEKEREIEEIRVTLGELEKEILGYDEVIGEKDKEIMKLSERMVTGNATDKEEELKERIRELELEVEGWKEQADKKDTLHSLDTEMAVGDLIKELELANQRFDYMFNDLARLEKENKMLRKKVPNSTSILNVGHEFDDLINEKEQDTDEGYDIGF